MGETPDRGFIWRAPSHQGPDGPVVFGAAPTTPPRIRGDLTLDGEVLGAFGGLTVPGHVRRTLQRLGSWVEPVLVGEWARLVRTYGERMGELSLMARSKLRLSG
jgi:hypothetical protein